MTIKLTKDTRADVVGKVLKEAFEPKFDDLQKRLVEYAREWVRINHPVFVELLAREDARAYILTGRFQYLIIDDETVRRPNYHGLDTAAIKVDEVVIPYNYGISNKLVIEDVDIILTYEKLRDDYEQAFNELSSVLAAYKTHEALLTDFPEYAKYLPEPVVKQLPAVIPSESRAKLSALGIPADASVL